MSSIKKKFKETKETVDEIKDGLSDLGIELGSFKKEYGRLRRMMGGSNQDFASDQASAALLRSVLVMLIGMLPTIEEAFHDNENNKGKLGVIYPMTHLLAQLKDYSDTLRSLGDKSEIIDSLMTNVVEKNLALMTQNLNTQFILLKRQLHVTLKNDDVRRKKVIRKIDKAMNTQVEYMTAIRSSFAEGITKLLES